MGPHKATTYRIKQQKAIENFGIMEKGGSVQGDCIRKNNQLKNNGFSEF
jgi:hypothetical protein